MLRRNDVVACLAPAQVIEAVRSALIAVAHGRVQAPAPMSFAFSEARGEAHVKGAQLDSSGDWAVKVATGFYGNPSLGLPVSSGLSLVSSAQTGLVHTIVVDGGHLTDVRTGAAGALAAAALTPPRIGRVGMVGTGMQARMQLEYLLQLRQVDELIVFGRDRSRTCAYAAEMHDRFGLRVETAADAREAVNDADLVITVTPSERPVVQTEWAKAGSAFVAVGSDMPNKQELDTALLERATVLVADDPRQAARIGELHHAPAAAAHAGWLGDLLPAEGAAATHTAAPRAGVVGGVKVADLTGLGAEDAAVAALVARRAAELDLGQLIELT